MADAKALIRDGKLPERSVQICLEADLMARMQELQRRLDEAESERKAGGASLASGSTSRELAAELDTVRREMLDRTITFRVRAVPRRRWTKMLAEHPPRKDHDLDTLAQYNTESFWDSAVRSCVVEPELDDEDWARLDEVISDGQWQELTNAVGAVNSRDVDVPFSRLASQVLQTSDAE